MNNRNMANKVSHYVSKRKYEKAIEILEKENITPQNRKKLIEIYNFSGRSKEALKHIEILKKGEKSNIFLLFEEAIANLELRNIEKCEAMILELEKLKNIKNEPKYQWFMARKAFLKGEVDDIEDYEDNSMVGLRYYKCMKELKHNSRGIKDITFIRQSELNFLKINNSYYNFEEREKKRFFELYKELTSILASEDETITASSVSDVGKELDEFFSRIYETIVETKKTVLKSKDRELLVSTSLRLNPNNCKLQIENAKIEMSKGNLIKANQSLEIAKQLNPNYLEIYLEIAKIEFKQNNIGEALSNINKVIEQNSKCVEAYIIRAKCHKMNNDITKAMSDLEKIIKMQPDCSEAYYEKGLIEYDMVNKYSEKVNLYKDMAVYKNKIDKAIETFEKSLKPDFEKNITLNEFIKDQKSINYFIGRLQKKLANIEKKDIEDYKRELDDAQALAFGIGSDEKNIEISSLRKELIELVDDADFDRKGALKRIARKKDELKSREIANIELFKIAEEKISNGESTQK